MKQLQAGYIIDGIAEYLSKKFSKEKVDGLLKQLSFFDTEIVSSVGQGIQNPEQILFVANNIISRGLPTRISLDLEKTILEKFGSTAYCVNGHINIRPLLAKNDFRIRDNHTKRETNTFAKKSHDAINSVV